MGTLVEDLTASKGRMSGAEIAAHPDYKPPRVSKGAAERAATKSRDEYRAKVAEDLAMHHRVIGELVQQVTALIGRVKALEDDKPRILTVDG